MNLSTLNPEQRAAVQHTEGPLLLLAGAGSGKTRVITCRIAYLLRRCETPPQAIVAVTFTNKAAREMKERVDDLVGRRQTKGMIVSTFHSLGMRILREDIAKLGYKKNFSIYGAADQARLVRDLLQGIGGERKIDADRVLWKFSDAKSRLLSPEQFVPRSQDEAELAAAQLYPRYQRALKAFNAVDFDDILLLSVRLLDEHPDVLERYRDRFRYLMVDEYQDTNPAQYRLLRLLCDGHRNLCVVGDDDQSIYAWRGADVRNILDFEKDFPDARVIKLEQNYRSTGTILSAANAVIRNNTKRKEKALWTSGESGDLIDAILCDDGEDEARVVVEHIHALRARHELAYRDFAILYRTNVQSRAFEEQLRYENIPYVLIGGQQFFDRKEVKDVLAYLQVLVNPRDEVNLLRILNYPRRGIGDTSADRLIRISAEQEKPLWEILKGAGEMPELGEKAQDAIASFVPLMERFRERFRRGGRLAEKCRELLAELKMEDEIYRNADDPAKGKRRVENMEEVVNAMASYEEREESPTLSGFLEKVSLLDRDTPGRGTKEEKLAQDAVILMSLHSSKGLEFPCVFLVGMEEEYLPHKKSLHETFDIDEERRLCYVGITRAQRILLLLGAARRKKFGRRIERVPSRFLAEIPAELLRHRKSEARPELSEAEQDKLAAGFFAGMKGLLGE